MKLVIIEGVGKKDTIKKYLGSDYEVVATKGHVRDLPQKTMGVNVKNNFEMQYTIMPDKQDIVKMLKEKSAKADKIYLATDPDREGEAISWHLCNILGLNPSDPIRIEFNEITKDADVKDFTMNIPYRIKNFNKDRGNTRTKLYENLKEVSV